MYDLVLIFFINGGLTTVAMWKWLINLVSSFLLGLNDFLSKVWSSNYEVRPCYCADWVRSKLCLLRILVNFNSIKTL